MESSYFSSDTFSADYLKLSDENREKVKSFVKMVLRLQQYEENLVPETYTIEQKYHHPTGEKGTRCSFCGKSQFDATSLIFGAEGCICDECARICAQVLDTSEAVRQKEDPGEYSPR